MGGWGEQDQNKQLLTGGFPSTLFSSSLGPARCLSLCDRQGLSLPADRGRARGGIPSYCQKGTWARQANGISVCTQAQVQCKYRSSAHTHKSLENGAHGVAICQQTWNTQQIPRAPCQETCLHHALSTDKARLQNNSTPPNATRVIHNKRPPQLQILEFPQAEG